MALFKDILFYNAQKLLKLGDSQQTSGSYHNAQQAQYSQPVYPGSYPQQYPPPAQYQTPQYGQDQAQPASPYPAGSGPTQAYQHPQQPYSNSPIPSPYSTPHQQPPPASTGPSFFSSMQSKLSSYNPSPFTPHLGQPTSTLHVRIARDEAEKSKTYILSNMFNNQPIFFISRADPSKKKLLCVSRPNGQRVGTIKFGYNITFTLHDMQSNGGDGGGEGKLKRSELTDKWSWRTLAFGGEKWVWKMKDHTTGKLKSERGEIIARIEREGLVAGLLSRREKKKKVKGAAVLKFEKGGLSGAGIDEVLITGFAAWEQSRRDKGDVEGVEAVAEVMMGGG